MPVVRRLPEHLRGGPGRVKLLRRAATELAAAFDAPVYLCGSALIDFNANPRDWDLRMLMPDAEFERHFGPVDKWEKEGRSGQWKRTRWRWSNECVKQTKWAWGVTFGLNVDFQIYPESYAKKVYHRRPRLRLDRRSAA